MWTKLDTINTGISIEAVKLSKLKLHNIYTNSESNHLNSLTCTGIWFILTSKNIRVIIRVVIVIHNIVNNWAPLAPIFLPNNPDINEPHSGNNIVVI